MLIHDLLLFAFVYFVMWLLQLIALPAIFQVSKKFTYLHDAGWGFARIFSILLLSLLVWNLAFMQIPINTSLGICLLFGGLLALSFYLSHRFFLRKRSFLAQLVSKSFWQNFQQKFGKIILIEESVFLLAMIFLFVIRSFQPEILGLEKFMDAGFIQSYLKSPTLPAKDMWFAGGYINYYSFGQFYNSVLVQLWRMDLAYGYNFLLMSVFGLFCLQLFSLAFNLRANLAKYEFGSSVLAGILAILLVALGANGHTLWYVIGHRSFEGYWYPDATRFIERTIHEFPAYSFVVSDLHAHVLSLPITLLLLLLIFVWLKELLAAGKMAKLSQMLKSNFFFAAGLMGVLFGVLVMTNTWDILIYGLLLTFTSLLLLIRNKSFFWPLVLSAVVVFAGTAIISAFWYMNFTPISSGLMLAKEHTPLRQLLILYGPHFFWAILLIFAIRPYFSDKKNDHSLPILALAIFSTVSLLIVFPEIFYFKDIYTSYPRANTMFKLVFQGFLLLGLLLSLFFSLILAKPSQSNHLFSWRVFDLRQLFLHRQKKLFLLKVQVRKFVFLYLPIGVFLFISTIVYPYLAYSNYYANLKNYQGLNGLAWFERKYPEDFVLMNYLKENESKQAVIVEAVGESYSEFARVSAFSGTSAILGWRVHEWLWRAGWDQPGQRTDEVRQIYESPQSAEAAALLKQYQVKYIVLGDKEREAYKKLDVEGILALGQVVASVGSHYLIKLF